MANHPRIITHRRKQNVEIDFFLSPRIRGREWGELPSRLSMWRKILGISYSSIKTMTFQWESALEPSSIVETPLPLYDRFPRISLFANTSDESLKISLSTFLGDRISTMKKVSLSLSLLSLAKKRWNLSEYATLFVPRGLYSANRSIGRQSNCVAIRRVAFERGEEKSGAEEWKEWTVYSEKGRGWRGRGRGKGKGCTG